MQFKKIIFILLSPLVFHSFLAAETYVMSPEKALSKLIEGNKRYTNDKLLHPNRDQERREALVAKQKPFAVIMGCSDSRVSPEVVFDQGIGDLFIVRTAGNVVAPVEIETIRFGSAQLGASVILVLGHENCGAVNAVMTGTDATIPVIANKIRPAIQHYVGESSKEALAKATKDNVRAIVSELKKNPNIAELIAKKRVEVVGGYYHLGSGEVELLR